MISSAAKRFLDRGLPDFAVGPFLSQLARLHRNGVRRVFRDGDLWIHETNIGYFVYQEAYIRLDLRRLDEIARKNFFWGYTPKIGDVIIDVGAGVGEETLTFSRAVGKCGKVICIEAHPKTFRCLEGLVRYNRLENVITVHQAITEAGRTQEIIGDSPAYLANHLAKYNGISVPATTIDGVRQRLGLEKIDFLKMNIEGAERLAIRGMSKTLEHTQALCICCHDFLAEERQDESCRTRSMVAEFLRQQGLTVVERSESGSPPYISHQVWAYNSAVPAVAR